MASAGNEAGQGDIGAFAPVHNRGHAVFINNIKPKGNNGHFEFRPRVGANGQGGANEDSTNFQNVFITTLGFKWINSDCFEDLSVQQWDHRKGNVVLSANVNDCKCIRCRIRYMDHSQSQCFVLAISSHGREITETEIIFSDGNSIYLTEILEAVDDNNCPTLEGKQRIIILNACRANFKDKEKVMRMLDRGVTVNVQLQNPPVKGSGEAAVSEATNTANAMITLDAMNTVNTTNTTDALNTENATSDAMNTANITNTSDATNSAITTNTANSMNTSDAINTANTMNTTDTANTMNTTDAMNTANTTNAMNTANTTNTSDVMNTTENPATMKGRFCVESVEDHTLQHVAIGKMPSNYLLVYPVVSGQTARSFETDGSWLIHGMKKIVQDKYVSPDQLLKPLNFLKFLTEVSGYIARERESIKYRERIKEQREQGNEGDWVKDEENSGYKNAVCFHHRLLKPIIFYPERKEPELPQTVPFSLGTK